MIAFRDFVPRRLRRQGFIKPPQYETFQEAVTAADAWVREQEVIIINIETVVVPALWGKDRAQSEEAVLGDMSAGPYSSYGARERYQFVRVWYKTS